MKTLSLTLAGLLCAVTVQAAEPVSILLVGNSYTFGRVDPVMSYNAANVHDLTAATARSGQALPVPNTPSAAPTTARLPIASLRLHSHTERMLASPSRQA